ncbi:MAG: class II aldolase/adducin family protein [Phycisphaerae bacterium]
MANIWQLKQEICEVGRRIYERGFVAANDGNISVRLEDGRYLCTPTGVSKGFMKPEDIATVDDEGNQIAGSLPRTSEVLLHLQIYHEQPEVNAVCHAHPPHATAFAVAGLEVPTCVLPEVEIFVGQVPLAQYDTPGSQNLAETILPHLRNKANTILLANHGAVACDSTLQQAYWHLETLDMYCRILLLSKDLGGIRQLPEEKVRELLEIKKKMGIDDPRLEGNMQICSLPGNDDFLRGFSEVCIPGHQPDADGHGRGYGIQNLPSQKGEPQPEPKTQPYPAVVAGREIPVDGRPGESSETARRRAVEDEMERMVQMITDRIVQACASQQG